MPFPCSSFTICIPKRMHVFDGRVILFLLVCYYAQLTTSSNVISPLVVVATSSSNRPSIGILTQDDGENSYIAASYVKFVEAWVRF